jgi:hypothetical protein
MAGTDWTVDTLKEHFDSLRIADGIALKAALDAAEKATAAALAAVDKANTVEKVTTDQRLHLLNELRSGVATLAALEALEKVVQDLTVRVVRLEESNSSASEQVTRTSSSRQLQVLVGGLAVGFLTAIIALIAVVLKAKGL